MLETSLEVMLVYDFIFICIKQLEKLKNLLIHIFILYHTKSNHNYIEIIAKNSDSPTLSFFSELLPVYLISCITS
jgi:hypothetical protein